MKSQVAAHSQLRNLFRQNVRLARGLNLGQSEPVAIHRLRELTMKFGLSLALGDFQYLNGGWYVTHAGLLRLAERSSCSGIRVIPVREFCDSSSGRWVFKATVYKTPRSRGFVGYGDADPSNVSPLVRGAEMRVAETRAVNRALRKAYGIGLCSVEELGSRSSFVEPTNGNAPHRCFREWFRSEPDLSSRSALPPDPQAPARFWSRQALCRRFLRHRCPPGCQPGSGRVLYQYAVRVGHQGS